VLAGICRHFEQYSVDDAGLLYDHACTCYKTIWIEEGDEVFRVIAFLCATGSLFAADFSGTWAGSTSHPSNATPMYLMLNQADEGVTGTIQFGSSGKEMAIQRAEVRGDNLVFEVRDKDGFLDKFALASVVIGPPVADPQLILRGDATLADTSALVFFYPTREDQPYTERRSASSPIVLRRVDPAYTDQAREAKVQGTVVLAVDIDAAGTISRDHIRVVRSIGHGLDEQAIECVTQWRFRPGFKDGFAVTTAATLEINFRL
jgi:TonB family protein